MQILSAMGKPGGGRAKISNRILSKFHVICFTVPTESNMKKIYETLGEIHFKSFYDEINDLVEPLALATITLFHEIQVQFLPTPAKSHYIFNMRDISKVFQGLFLADKNYYESKEQIVKLWGHEVLRVFYDRLVSIDDQTKFLKMVDTMLENHFSMNYEEHCTTQSSGQHAIFVDFLSGDEENRVYEEVAQFE